MTNNPITRKNPYFDEKGDIHKDIKEKLNSSLNQVGTILELKVIDFALKKGYVANELFYKDLNSEKNRQCDLVARKRITFKLMDTKINFDLHIVGDCKYKSSMDILFFDNGLKYEDIYNFPIAINEDLILPFGSFKHPSFAPLVSSKSTQINPEVLGRKPLNKSENKKNGHLIDREIYEATQQVFSAVNFHYQKLKEELNEQKKSIGRHALVLSDYSSLKSQYNTFDTFMTIKENAYANKKEFLKYLLNGVEYISIKCIIPLIIFDENTMLLKARLNNKFELTNVENIQLGLLKVDTDFKPYPEYENYIFLANLKGFDSLLKYLDDYLEEMKKYITDTINTYPKTTLCNIIP